jgi:hypothetical protein
MRRVGIVLRFVLTCDSDGILQDEHIGDASIEGKLKKLVKRASESELAGKPGQ